ncbi:hypothetical protein [Longimicrobium terrae]|uniref:Uncharacterized protein n=1 Tax=Longimicrobium terrae TaxID=1639882 RepID=A0A841H508_9BACT|nr:hypothetical protein [Longimicrobium terrae]MBB4638982.1 hypothetical protein [Longimicrobium terrae]MBB6073221.1 hypothetical protein [Longimicrobium terrae]NNC32328.1 hypothetical protein [Longimicrobium terrae]
MDKPDRPYTYGDFPELFWDLQKDVAIDGTDPLVISRVLREGNLEHVRRIVPTEALIQKFDELILPRNVRTFWALMVDKLRVRHLDNPA